MNIEQELKSKLNSTNNTIYILTNELDNLQKEIEEKNINNNKLFEDCQNLSFIVENKTENIKKLKLEKKKLEKINNDLKLEIEQKIKEIEYLISQNKELKNEKCSSNQSINKETNSIYLKDTNVEYYEKQLNDSNNTIKRMGDMIKELEKQIEELQKEIEENNYDDRKKYDYNQEELINIIKQKDKEIKQYKMQIELISEEKNKLYEDNTKMYNDLDRFQKYILDLSEQNKKLSIKISNYTNENDKKNSILYKKKENDLKNISEDEIEDIKNTIDIKTIVNNNYDDISQNNFTSLNFDTLLKSSNNINNNEENKNYNGSQANENQNKTYNNNNKKRKVNKLKGNDSINNDNQEENKADLYFDYDSKDPEELSD